MQKYRLLIKTDDQIGIIYKVTKILYNHSINIEKNNEFVDLEKNKFFMRSEITGNINRENLLKDLKEQFEKSTEIRIIPETKKNIVLLVTKESHCLGDILIRYQNQELSANIKGVISNHNNLQSLVENFKIPFFTVPHQDLSREEHEQEIIKILNVLQPELIVLAKYMRILSPEFVSLYPQKILNIHHSFLPSFIGANPYKQAYQRGVKIIGATAHYVNNFLDDGPIVSQDILHIDHSFSWQDMQRAGRDVEKVVLAKALNLVLEDHVFVEENKTIVF